MNSAAQLVPDAAVADPPQGVERTVQGCLVASQSLLDQPTQIDRHGKFWGCAETTHFGVIHLPELYLRPACQIRQVSAFFRHRMGDLAQRLHNVLAVFIDQIRPLAPDCSEVGQQVHQTGGVPELFPGQVGYGHKRMFVWRHEDVERPTAATGQQLGYGHIEVVDIRAFLPINLDADEVAVDQAGQFLILEGFVGHDVTPVAGGVADREEDRHVFPLRLFKGSRPPFVPVHRIFGVLDQIGAAGKDQAVEAFAAIRGQGSFVESHEFGHVAAAVNGICSHGIQCIEILPCFQKKYARLCSCLKMVKHDMQLVTERSS